MILGKPDIRTRSTPNLLLVDFLDLLLDLRELLQGRRQLGVILGCGQEGQALGEVVVRLLVCRPHLKRKAHKASLEANTGAGARKIQFISLFISRPMPIGGP